MNSEGLAMHAPQASRTARKAFTLVELVVVIAIITLLAALGTMAVMRVLRTSPDSGDMTDIKLIEQAVGNFYEKFKVFPPDSIKLVHFEEDYFDASGNYLSPLDRESHAYLQLIWPRIFKNARRWSDPQPPSLPLPWAGYPRDAIGNID